MKALRTAGGAFFIISGILFFIFLRELNDPEIEGDSGRISLGTYLLSLIPITIGVVILFFSKGNKSHDRL